MAPIRPICGLLCIAALACGGRDDFDGSRRVPAGLTETGQEYAVEADNRPVLFDLFDNRAAASVYPAGSLVIDCGTADFAKYVEGAYRSGWHLGVDDQGVRASLPSGLAGELYFPLDSDEAGIKRERSGSISIHLRARAAKAKQLVSVFLNENKLGDLAMATTGWSTYRIRAPERTLRNGENKLRFYFKHAGDIAGRRSAAAFARVTVGPIASTKPGFTTSTVTRDGKRLSALRVSRPTRLSWFVLVPKARPELVFAVAGAGASLAVRVAASGTRAAETVWEGKGAKAWSRGRVELAEYAGQVVRVDLVSSAAADWGRPRIVGAPRRQAARADPGNDKILADHIIVWVVSALRYDRLDGPAVPTPAFARFADGAFRFSGATAAAPAPGPAHVALLTGTYPFGGTIPDGTRTLAERFREAGYTTALISGNGFVNDEAGFARGFDTYMNPMRRRHAFGARILWQKARRLLLDHKSERTFIYIATVEPHLPYTPSPASLAAEWGLGSVEGIAPASTAAFSKAVRAAKVRPTSAQRNYIEALYDAEVRDADAAFGQMLTDLDSLDIADRTAVILVGDHGEELWERGGFGHGTNLHGEVLRIPLVIRPPRVGEPRVVDGPAEQIDIYATALDLGGISANPEVQGRSLLPMLQGREPARPRPVFSHLPGYGRSVSLGRFKLIVPKRGAHKLYDVGADPGELNNLIGERPLIERHLRNVFGIAIAYHRAWRYRRWGTADNMTAAFAADHGL